jgi:hypothetical protein
VLADFCATAVAENCAAMPTKALLIATATSSISLMLTPFLSQYAATIWDVYRATFAGNA